MKVKNGSKTKKLMFPKTMSEIAVFLVILVFFAIRDITILFYGAQALFIITIFYSCSKKKINIKYTITLMIFIVWVIASFLWATSMDNASKFTREIIQISVIGTLLSFYCDDIQEVKKVLEYIAIATAIMIIYLLIKTPLAEWNKIYNYTENIASSEGRLGITIGLHPNRMGTLVAIVCLIWVYILKVNEKKISIVWICAAIILILFTKSRGSILCMLSFLFIYWLFEKPRAKNIIYKAIICFLLAIIGVWAIFNVKILYNLIGFRFEGMLGMFDTSQSVDASTKGRNMLKEIGKEMIKDHPILGVGAGNYANVAYYNYGLWREVYSHSNFIEIFSNLGIIGFLIYYIPRLWCCYTLGKNLKNTRENERQICAMLFSFCISSIIFDYIKISYNNEPEQIMYTLSFCVSIIFTYRNKKQIEYIGNEGAEIRNENFYKESK